MNPFTGQSSQAVSIPVPTFLRDWGFHLQESMLKAAHSVSEGGGGSAAIIAFSIAILFGIVHIIGPGHGKLFTIGYFGSRKAKLSEGIALSALINVLDAISALILVGIAYGILTVSLKTAGALASQVTKMIAYGAIVILGIVYLIGYLQEERRQKGTDSKKKKILKPWVLALSVGLIPCPVSSAILAWGIVNKALGFSLILVLGVSVGGMIAMSLFSLAIIGGKAGLVKIMEKKGLKKAMKTVEISSIIFLILAGILLFIITI